MEGVGGGEIKINSFFLNLMAVTQPSPAREGFFMPKLCRYLCPLEKALKNKSN